MVKWLTLISLFSASLICYIAGSTVGMIGFIAAGVILELLFYFEVFDWLKKHRSE